MAEAAPWLELEQSVEPIDALPSMPQDRTIENENPVRQKIEDVAHKSPVSV